VRVIATLAGAGARLFAAACFGFLLFRVLPGDPVLTLNAGRPVTAEVIAARRRELGLDRPLPAQFGDYLGDLLHGRLGVSYGYRRPVTQLIAERVGPTLLLAGTATVLAVLLGVWGGARAGWRPGGPFDRVSTTSALVLWATPTAWLGLLLLVAVGAGAGPLPGLFPIGGLRATPPPAGAVAAALDVAHHLVLPCLTLVAVQYGQYHLLTRTGVLGEAGRHHVTVARATGLRDAVVRRRHVLPNALLPVATQAALGIGFAVSGAVAVEAVFSWPGLGSLAYEAVLIPDLPVLNGTFLVFSAAVIGATAAADLMRARLDPRARP
jgi:peptide/nickel transport system permease protein